MMSASGCNVATVGTGFAGAFSPARYARARSGRERHTVKPEVKDHRRRGTPDIEPKRMASRNPTRIWQASIAHRPNREAGNLSVQLARRQAAATDSGIHTGHDACDC